jgi:hypothetical protein
LQTRWDAIPAAFQKPFSPVQNGLAVDVQPPGALIDGDPFVGPQNDARPISDASFGVA